MQNGFIKGVMVGGIIAASVSMMMTSDMVGDVADMFR